MSDDWEYRFVYGTKGRAIEDELNDLGGKGWEAVGIALEPGIAFRRVAVLLKRRRAPERITRDL